MSEATSNVEFAHKIHEHSHRRPSSRDRREQWLEIVEAVVLAIVAVATAWSGYQASKWNALSARNYNLASRTSVASQGKATLAGQERLYDITSFNGWVSARMAGQPRMTDYFARRFRPEYAAAFVAWQKLDPLNNPSAPPGPIFMKEYLSANAQEAARLADEAGKYFDEGVEARETGDKYVKVTVLLATVLLLTALSQRFEVFAPRVAVVAAASLLLVSSILSILTLPRA